MLTREIWDKRSIPALGLGCWAIGGVCNAGGVPVGWGQVDDAESIRAIHCAVDLGIRFFDTAQAYGAGHSEEILGQALASRPDVLVGTKVGVGIDPDRKQMTGPDYSNEAIVASIDDSLKRLRRERIDLVHLHLNSLPIDEAAGVFDTLDVLRAVGKINKLGWSTDYPDRAAAFAGRDGFVSVQHAMNVFFRADALVPVVERYGLLSINRSPLAMGLLSGKYRENSVIGPEDVRSGSAQWLDYFKNGHVAPAYAQRLDAVRELLRDDGRTLVQGALAWLWARTPNSLPIPGFRTEAQVRELAGALAKGPLPPAVMDEIERVIVREPEGEPRDR
jgi:aryl-alcohol dehydrogenase-like predicted oxidoreductase